MTKIVNFHRAQQLSAAEEQRMQQRAEQQRPPTKYEQDLERLAKDYLQKRNTKK